MMKRLCAVALTIVLLLSMTMTVFADPPEEPDRPGPWPLKRMSIAIIVQPCYTAYDDITYNETP